MKKYLSYKEAIEKLTSNLPPKWNTCRAKGIFNQVDVRSQTGDEQLLSVSEHRGVVPRNEMKITMFMAESYEGYKLCEAGDLVINSLWAWGRGIGVSEYSGIVSTAYGVFRPKNKNQFNPKYLNYLLRTKDYVALYYMRSKGIWISRLQLQDKNFLDLPIICPPKEEQDEIVQYIKAQEEKINLFIKKKQRFIELLKEQRLSIVFKTVTKGINANVPFAETNIDWIGKIPRHWKLKRIKYLCKISNGMDCEKEDIGKFPVYGSGGIFGWTNNFLYDKPSVLLGRKGTIDKPIFVTEPFWTVDTAFFTKIFEEAIEPSFFYQLCCCIPFESLSTKTALPSMTQTTLYQVKMPVPPLEEQKQIVSHIKTETTTIDTAIAKAEREIELIREYKEAMVNEAVMGKRSIHNLS